ncbi:MAG: TetR/AcrR family transcriptional regulator [Gemmobacter sp.]
MSVPTPALPVADQRIAGILLAARQAFAEKGFDGASMQDLARTAGMSVGNFYRYFPSKAAIVEALIARDLAEMEQDFATILTAPAPMQALRAKIRDRVTLKECLEDGPVWAEICAAALRKPEIGAAAQRMEDEIVVHLTTVFARITGQTPEMSLQRHGTRAALIVMLVQTIVTHAPATDPRHQPLVEMVLRIIDDTLDAVATDTPAGKPA